MAATTAPAFDSSYAVAEADLCNEALGRVGEEAILDTDEDTEVARVCRRHFARTRNEMLRKYDFAFARRTAFLPEAETEDKDGRSYAYAIPAELRVLKVLSVGDHDDVEDFERLTDLLLSDASTFDPTEFSAATVSGSPSLGNCKEDLGLEGRYVEGLGIPVLTYILSQAGSVITLSRNATADGTGIVVSVPRALRVRYAECVLDTSIWDDLFTDAFILRLASKIAFPLTGKWDLAQSLQAEYAVVIGDARRASSQEQELDEGDQPWTERG
jgi:hypothetical protein